MEDQEKVQRLEILYQSKQELEGIVKRADKDRVKFFEDQLSAIKKEINSLETTS